MKVLICIFSVVLMSVKSQTISYAPAVNATMVLCDPVQYFYFKNPDDVLTVETPNYPGNYETGARCKNFVHLGKMRNTEYFLQVQTASAVDMAPRTDRNGSLRCQDEYVKFRNVLTPELVEPLKFKKVCESDTLLNLNVLYSTRNRLAIDFDTNNDGNIGTGAQFIITASLRSITQIVLCESTEYTFTDPMQELILYSPGYPGSYLPSSTCNIDIHLGVLAGLGYELHISTVERLNMQDRIDVNGKPRCALDYIKFKDVRRPGKNSVSGQKACGTDNLINARAMISTLPTQVIQYATDATIEGDAFSLRIAPIAEEA